MVDEYKLPIRFQIQHKLYTLTLEIHDEKLASIYMQDPERFEVAVRGHLGEALSDVTFPEGLDGVILSINQASIAQKRVLNKDIRNADKGSLN